VCARMSAPTKRWLAPVRLNGWLQEMASRGVSMVYALGDAEARGRLVESLVGVLQVRAGQEGPRGQCCAACNAVIMWVCWEAQGHAAGGWVGVGQLRGAAGAALRTALQGLCELVGVE